MDGSTQDLLKEQSELVQRALFINLEIASRLGQERSGSSQIESAIPEVPPHSSRDVTHKWNTPITMAGQVKQDADAHKYSYELDSLVENALGALGTDLSQPLLRPPSSGRRTGGVSKDYSHYFFPQVEEFKNTVSKNIRSKRYSVEDFYKETGLCQALARSEYFKGLAMVVIALNTIWIAFETDYNKSPILCKAPVAFQVADNTFCAFFTAEILIRLMAFKDKWNALSDSWFIFDTILVLQMCWETWLLVALYMLFGIDAGGFGQASNLLRLIRLFRLARVARAARLVQSAPELLILATGIFAAVRSVVAVMCLLLLVVYVFAVVFTQLLSGTVAGAGQFDNVPQALNTLLVAVICGPESAVLNKLLVEGLAYYMLFIVFVLLALFTIMNMLIGILCGVVGEVSQQNKEGNLEEDLENEISRLARAIDADHNQVIDKEEFDSILMDPEMTYDFHCLGVDIASAADFAKHIFGHMDAISLSDFQHLVVQFRRDKGVTAKDIMDMRKFISMEMLWLEARLHAQSPPTSPA